MALNNQTESKESAQGASVKPKQRVQPKGSIPTPDPSRNGWEKKVQPKVQPKGSTAQPKAQPTEKPKAGTTAPKTDTPKAKGGASYVIPKEFKQAIEDYLNGRADMKAKLSAKGKTIDGCCDYIFDVMRKRAEKQRGGKSAVGLYAPPDEIFGLAVHYYDETDEALKSEK